jgi:hypothetical protein
MDVTSRNLNFGVTSDANLVGIERMERSIRRLQATVARTPRTIQPASRHIRDLDAQSYRATTTIRRMGTALLFFAGAGAVSAGFRALVKSSLDFSRNLETAKLSIASLIAASANIADSTGKMLSPAQAFVAATEEAQRQMAALRKETLLTSASFDELAQAFQVAVAPGLQGGLNLDQIRVLARRISQAATTLGMPQAQMPEEIRSLLQGTIRPQTTRIATVLGIKNEDVKRWKEAGTLAEELFKRFEAFEQAEGRLAQTFSGLLGRVRAALSFAAGEAGEGLFVQLKNTFREILDFLLEVDETGVRINSRVLAVMREIFKAIGDVIVYAAASFKALDFESAFATVEGIAGAIRSIGRFVIDIVVGIGRALSIFGRMTSLAREFLNSMGATADSTGGAVRQAATLYTLWFGVSTLLAASSVVTSTLLGTMQKISIAAGVIHAQLVATLLPMAGFLSLATAVAVTFNNVTQDINKTKFSFSTQFAALLLVLEKGAKLLGQAIVKSLNIAASVGILAFETLKMGVLTFANLALGAINKVVWLVHQLRLAALKSYAAIKSLEASFSSSEEVQMNMLKLEKQIDDLERGGAPEVFSNLGEAIKTEMGKSAAAMLAAKDNLKVSVIQNLGSLKEEVDKAWSGVWEGTGKILEQDGEQALKTKLKGLASGIEESFKSAISGLQNISTRAEAAGGGYETLAERAKKALAEVQAAQAELTGGGVGGKITEKKEPPPGMNGYVEAFEKGFEGFIGTYTTMLEVMRNITTGFLSSLTSLISDSIVAAFDPTNDKGLKERFASFLQDISRLILNEMIKWAIMQAAIGIFGSGFMGVPAKPTMSIGASPTVGGFARGGRIRPIGLAAGGRPPGLPATDTVPIWATPGEFMVRAGSVRKYGEDTLAAINQGLINPMALRGLTNVASGAPTRSRSGGYADGGEIPQSKTVPVAGPSGVLQAAVVANEEHMDRLLAGGKAAQIRFIRNNARTINGLIGGRRR